MKTRIIWLLAGLCFAFGELSASQALNTSLLAQVTADTKLVNESARGKIATGQNVFIIGFNIVPAKNVSPDTAANLAMRVLIRGVGPSIKQFNLPNAAKEPKLALYKGSQVIETNEGWNDDFATSVMGAAVGAFPLQYGSKDSAILANLAPGGYTVVVTDSTSDGDDVLVELYDVVRDGLLRLGNMSVRSGRSPVILGFVADGVGTSNVLVRAIGPSLGMFGVENTVADPKLVVYNGSAVINQNDNWQPEVSSWFGKTGAFPLPSGSKDSALVVPFAVSGPTTRTAMGYHDGQSGAMLVELYELP